MLKIEDFKVGQIWWNRETNCYFKIHHLDVKLLSIATKVQGCERIIHGHFTSKEAALDIKLATPLFKLLYL